jgi:hypothetical protein
MIHVARSPEANPDSMPVAACLQICRAAVMLDIDAATRVPARVDLTPAFQILLAEDQLWRGNRGGIIFIVNNPG